MNIDARSAGPPSFVRQPAIYQPNPKELQHPSQHSSAVNRRWSSRKAGIWSRSESHHPDPLKKGVLCPFVTPVTPPAPGGKGKGGCIELIQGGECTKLGLSNRTKRG